MKVHIWSAIFFVFGIPFYRQVEFGTPRQAKVLEIPSKTTSSTTVTELLNKWVTNNSTSAKKYKQWNYSGGTYSFKSE